MSYAWAVSQRWISHAGRVREEWNWLDIPVDEAARRLLGCELHRDVQDTTLRVRIVEVEAYDQHDEASHTYRGQTPRNSSMFLSAGHAYVYLIHGIHNCLNIVTGRAGFGSGVLVRAVEPIAGTDFMVKQRSRDGFDVTNGPGKLTQAMAIDMQLNGHDLAHPPLRLVQRPPLESISVVTTTRIGISKAVDEPRRFYEAANPYVSRR